MPDSEFQCYLVSKDREGRVDTAVVSRNFANLPNGDVLIQVTHSSLNYKDALAATGHPGVARSLPHVPGIDAVGTVCGSDSTQWQIGDEVIVTGYGLGSDQWGGWSELIRVPSDWIVRLPEGLSAIETMTLGTAGFTAAQCVQSLQHHGITPDAGDIVVTGASGGVGSLAVSILTRLGYRVVAVSGKTSAHNLLRQLGAVDIIDRDAVTDDTDKPLLPVSWSGAIDTVGGKTLSTLLRKTAQRGCVAACGLVGGSKLSMTVYPFLLRGVTLDGIDSAACPMPERQAIWEKLAGAWKPENLDLLRTTVHLNELDAYVQQILNGQVAGRIVVRIEQ